MIKHRVVLSLCFLASFLVLLNASYSQTTPETSFRFLDSNYRGERFSEEKIVQSVRANFDVSAYREVRIAVMNGEGGLPYIVVQLLSRKYHRVDVARINVDSKFDVLTVMKNYKMSPQDYRNQFKINSLPTADLRLSALACPNVKATFLTFAPNDDALEQSVSAEVTKSAKQHGHTVVALLIKNATHDNLIRYLKCPALKGVFYDGDANPNEITTYDGVLQAAEIIKLFKFRNKVTHIWLACQAFNDPMLSTMITTAQAQKYAAGKNDLEIGPSDRAAACAMKAALDGKPMTAAFWACYDAEDKATDEWGFDGHGSDLFGR
jgi:hypothetical protein